MQENLPFVINALGHAAGVIIFGAFLYLLWLGRRRDPGGDFVVPAMAAILALLWNVLSLAVLATVELAGGYTRVAVALSFAVLSLLPGVLLHLSLGSGQRWIRSCGYLLSLIAVATHLAELFGGGEASHRFALLLITFGFGALALLAASTLAREKRRLQGASLRALAAMALFFFAVSFIHFGSSHGSDAWAQEVLLHHAGIPLALVILLQGHRMLLMDVFVRFLGNALTAAVAAFLLLGLAGFLGLIEPTSDVPFSQSIWIVAGGLVLVAFPAIRKRVQNRLEATIFRRGDPESALEEIRACLEANQGDEESLERAGEVMAGFANAERWQVVEDGTEIGTKLIRTRILPDRETDGRSRRHRWAEVEVPIRTSGEETCRLLLGRRQGGRRYLSQDLEDLDRLSTELSDQVERRRRTELNRLVAEAELDALRAQINPHFLFNSLNALYATIPRSAVDARETLVNLAEIFRYSLQGTRQFVSLDQEMRIVQAYLQIERLRLGERLRTGIDIAEDTLQIAVPVLSIQPLVENAVKHGVSSGIEVGTVRIESRIVGESLRVIVSDDGPGFPSTGPPSGAHGLENVRGRLRLCYGERASLKIASPPTGAEVELRVPATLGQPPDRDPDHSHRTLM